MTRRKTRSPRRRSLAGRVLRGLFWIIVFIGLLLAGDRALMRWQPQAPLLTELHGGYREFRQRLLGLLPQTVPKPAPPEGRQEPAPPRRPAAQPGPPKKAEAAARSTKRYLYVDQQGELQFADRLEDIPTTLRSSAQPLDG